MEYPLLWHITQTGIQRIINCKTIIHVSSLVQSSLTLANKYTVTPQISIKETTITITVPFSYSAQQDKNMNMLMILKK